MARIYCGNPLDAMRHFLRFRGTRKALQSRRRSGISEIVGTLLLIVITVGLGVTVFSLATGGFSSFGVGFSNMVSNAGNQISEQITIEQIVINVTSPLGANIYVRNYGTNSVTITTVYVTNTTASQFVEAYQLPSSVTINSGNFANIAVKGFTPDHGTVYSFTLATTLGTTVSQDGKAV